MSSKVRTGLEKFEKNWPKFLKAANIGLLVHPASINSRYSHSTELY